MSKLDKKKVAFDKLAKVYETVLGIDPKDFNEDAILGIKPDGVKSSVTYFGADEIEMLRSMLHIEASFQNTISDELFVPRTDVVRDEMWRNRPIADLVTFCVDTMMSDNEVKADE